MADVRKYIKINPLDLSPDVAVGVSLPFDGEAVFNSTYSTKEQIKSNMLNVLLTEPGERVLEPEFGVGLKLLLFEQNVDQELVKSRINDQINIYIPEIELAEVNLNFQPDEHTLFIAITYRFVLDDTLDSIQLNFNNK